MRNFILGIVITILVLLIVGLGVALLGFVPTNANTEPPKLEQQIAKSAIGRFDGTTRSPRQQSCAADR